MEQSFEQLRPLVKQSPVPFGTHVCEQRDLPTGSSMFSVESLVGKAEFAGDQIYRAHISIPFAILLPCLSIPKGLRNKAQGCEHRATLGNIPACPSTPKELCRQLPKPLKPLHPCLWNLG